MADVVVDNSFFLHQESNTQIVPNPTYGRYQFQQFHQGDNSSEEDRLSESMTTLDYQSVSDYNPNYVSNCEPAIIKAGGESYPPFQQQQLRGDEHVNGIPIPQQSSSSSNASAITSGFSVPTTNSINVKTPDLSGVPPGSLPNHRGSPTESSARLLPPSQASSGGILYYNSQTSEKSDELSSSTSSSNTGPKSTSRPTQGPKPMSTQYSYAMQPFTRPGRSVSESEGVVIVTAPSPVPSQRLIHSSQSISEPKPPLPPPITRTMSTPKTTTTHKHHNTTSFAATNKLFVGTDKNISYGKFARTLHHYHRDPLKVQDMSPTIDLILGIFSIVSILISLVVIVLVIVLVTQPSSSTSTTNTGVTTTIGPLATNTTTKCDCQAAFDKVKELQSSLQSIQASLNSIKQNASSSILSDLASLVRAVSSLNRSLRGLQHRSSSDLKATTTVDLLSDGCMIERKAEGCRTRHDLNLYICRTPQYPIFDENDMVAVDFYCNSRPSDKDNDNIFINKPVNGSGSTVATSLTDSVEGPLDQGTRETLKFSCFCYLFDLDLETECDVYIKRCPIARQSVPINLIT